MTRSEHRNKFIFGFVLRYYVLINIGAKHLISAIDSLTVVTEIGVVQQKF